MSTWSKYIVAKSVEEALKALATTPGAACPIAGGTDLMLDFQQQSCTSPIYTLVDITNIPELHNLEQRGNSLFIGAGVTVRKINESPLIRRHAMALSEACGLIGGLQVRNMATLGGNVAHALPAADGTIALVALDAKVEIASPIGRRIEPILKIFHGVGQSSLSKDCDILVGFHIPIQTASQGSAFGRIMCPQGIALPVLNLSVWLQREEKHIQTIRIAVGPAGPIPQRAIAIEDFLAGTTFSQNVLGQAKTLVDSTLHFRTSPMRATAAYRYHLCKMLLEEIIGVAWQRAYWCNTND
jgi:CO/xanthine dehydrogenase FAD-binding subunit